MMMLVKFNCFHVDNYIHNSIRVTKIMW